MGSADVSGQTPRTGHYFEFKRGTWAVDAAGKKTEYPGSGIAYVGSLTEAAKNGLDELINEYVSKEGAKNRQETDDVCVHRYYKTHCRICLITKLETELAEAVAALKDANKEILMLLGMIECSAEFSELIKARVAAREIVARHS